MKTVTFFLFLISLSFFACNSANQPLPMDESGREDFVAFHTKFYSDSSFQLQRIEFPLLGNDPDGGTERFFWELENWTFKKAVDPENDQIKAIPFYDMETVIRERIIVQDAFMIQNMFSLIDNKWYLTEYSGMRDLAFFAPKKTVQEVLPEVALDSMSTDSLQ